MNQDDTDEVFLRMLGYFVTKNKKNEWCCIIDGPKGGVRSLYIRLATRADTKTEAIRKMMRLLEKENDS